MQKVKIFKLKVTIDDDSNTQLATFEVAKKFAFKKALPAIVSTQPNEDGDYELNFNLVHISNPVNLDKFINKLMDKLFAKCNEADIYVEVTTNTGEEFEFNKLYC